jgi:hypothetical protein
MEAAAKKTILRIEILHLFILVILVGVLGPRKWIEPIALIAGGLFMASNFFLLSYGVASLLTPLAGKGRIKFGVSLLALKLVLFLGLLALVFVKLDLDAISFTLGFSSLIAAIVIEGLRTRLRSGS